MATPINYNNIYPIKYLGNRVQNSIATCTSYLQDYNGNIVSIVDILTTIYVSTWSEFLIKLKLIVDSGIGGVINIAPTTLLATSTAIIPSNIKIMGSGKNVSIIKALPGLGLTNIFNMNSATNITIQNLTFDADEATNLEIINAEDTTNVLYENCAFLNINNGLFILQSGTNSVMCNCDFSTGTGSSAISISGTGHRIIQSSFDNFAELSITTADKLVFNSNYITTIGSIQISGSNNILFANNVIEDFSGTMIFTTITELTISDNIFKSLDTTGSITLNNVENSIINNNLFDFAANNMISTSDSCNTILIKNNQLTGTQISNTNSFFDIDIAGTNIMVINNNCKRNIPLTANANITKLYDSQLNIVVTAGATINITLSSLTEESVDQIVYITNDATSTQAFDLLNLYDPIGSYTHTVVAAGETCVIMWTGFNWRLLDPADSTPA